MGWKNVKEHYRIAHQVQVRAGRICIGSPYISELIVIRADGTLEKRCDGRVNEDLVRYQREMEADPAQLRRLIETPDTFTASLRVYTFEDGEIIEKFCECLGWPNVTHDGQMMYENTFSADRGKVLAWARRNAELELEAALGNVRETEEKLEKKRAWAARAQADVEKLKDAHAKRPWWKTFMRAMGQVAGRLQQDGGEAGSPPARSRKLCRAGAGLCQATLLGLGYSALVLAGVGVARIDSLGVVGAEVVIGHLLICAAGHRLFRKLP